MSEELAGKRSPSLGRILALSLPLILFGALAIVFYIQLTSGKNSQELPSAFIGKPAPKFSLPPLPGLVSNGIDVPGVSNDDFQEKVTLVNIFASWCAPCRLEHPVLVEMSKINGLDIVGINYKDPPANALKFLNELGNPYKRVGTDRKGRTAIEWGFYGIPETLLVDREGIVRFKVVGPITQDKFSALRAELDKLL